ncbi:unnamed protein product, partial [Amoebophrya sp. A25]
KSSEINKYLGPRGEFWWSPGGHKYTTIPLAGSRRTSCRTSSSPNGQQNVENNATAQQSQTTAASPSSAQANNAFVDVEKGSGQEETSTISTTKTKQGTTSTTFQPLSRGSPPVVGPQGTTTTTREIEEVLDSPKMLWRESPSYFARALADPDGAAARQRALLEEVEPGVRRLPVIDTATGGASPSLSLQQHMTVSTNPAAGGTAQEVGRDAEVRVGVGGVNKKNTSTSGGTAGEQGGLNATTSTTTSSGGSCTGPTRRTSTPAETALQHERVAFLSSDNEGLTHDAFVLKDTRSQGSSSVATSEDSACGLLKTSGTSTALLTKIEEADIEHDPPPAPVTGGLSRIKRKDSETILRTSRFLNEGGGNDPPDGGSSSSSASGSGSAESSAASASGASSAGSCASSPRGEESKKDLRSSEHENKSKQTSQHPGEEPACSSFESKSGRVITPAAGNKGDAAAAGDAPAHPVTASTSTSSIVKSSSSSTSSAEFKRDPIRALFAHKDLKGMTAFMLGVRRHHIGLVHFLLKQYANGKYAKELVLAVNEYAGNETAFMLTAKLGFETILSLILSCCQKGMPLEDLDIWTDLLNARNTEEKSAIMLACQYNRVEIVRLLLHFGRGRYKL